MTAVDCPRRTVAQVVAPIPARMRRLDRDAQRRDAGIEEANVRAVSPGPQDRDDRSEGARQRQGQYDPAQAAENTRKFVANPRVIALIGPDHSGAGKAMAPILSQGDLATVTPDTTSPDITSPKFAKEFRPAGKPIYFRTLTTDDNRGPGMARFMVKTLGARTGFILDDSGAYGVWPRRCFAAGARAAGMEILGRVSLDPKHAPLCSPHGDRH